MVAEEPVRAAPARAAARAAGRRGRGAVRRAAPRVRATTGRGFVLVAGRRRLPLPEPPRPRALRRAVRARGPVARLSAAALETLAIVAYKQPISRAQVARSAASNVDGVDAHAAAAGLHRRGRPRPRARARRCCSAPRRCSSSGSASTRSTTCRRSATSCPAPMSSRRSRRRCALRGPMSRATVCRAERGATAEGARAGGPRQPARLRGADRRRPGAPSTARSRARSPGRRRASIASRSTACRSSSRPGLVYYLLNKPRGRGDDGARPAAARRR